MAFRAEILAKARVLEEKFRPCLSYAIKGKNFCNQPVTLFVLWVRIGFFASKSFIHNGNLPSYKFWMVAFTSTAVCTQPN
ncbi:MAG: hypothetical protein NZ936_16835, partial [Alphaproteobacteria bacterium]|nr:hypothetical protein [Alphaproteobacteria bacterium]